MKIAIHHRAGSFSDRWIDYCKKEKIDYKLVNAFDTDIVEQVKECDAFMWHHHHTRFKDVLTAKRILFALEHAGVKVFPNFCTGWHFDDKVAQKYLLEAINAPLVPSYIFYNKNEAIKWAKRTDYPKVFKLKGGSGSKNVHLVKNSTDAVKLINKSFGKGFAQFDRLRNLKERYNKYLKNKETLIGVLKGVGRIFIPTKFSKMKGNEIGYAYFQEFIPNNNCDTRVMIVGDKAFAAVRKVREGDFRASGSGNTIYSKDAINLEMIKISFEIVEKLNVQSIAFDYIIKDGVPLIVEISYGFTMTFPDPCPGYWDKELNWYQGKFIPQEWMVENLISDI